MKKQRYSNARARVQLGFVVVLVAIVFGLLKECSGVVF